MMKRYVSLWFPHLATDWTALRQPQLRNTAFVLAAPLHGRMIINAVSPMAQAQGIYPGMAAADAKALCPLLQVLDDLPNLTGQLLQRIAEWAIRFTPVAATDAPGGILLNASGCTHLWGGEERYIADINKRLTTRGYTVRIAIADTIGAAWAVARYGGQASVVVTPGTHIEALMTLPAAALRLDSDTEVRLHKLGLKQVKDFISIPKAALRRRFGAKLLQRIGQATGEVEEFIIPVYPPATYGERLPCIEPIITRTGIEIALERLLVMLCNRLRKEGKGIRTAYFRGYRTDSTAQGIEIATSRVTHNVEHLYHLFSIKLNSIEPVCGIELFVLEATGVEPYETLQESIWDTTSLANKEDIAQLVDRITNKLGADAVKRYLPAERHLPEKSYRETTSPQEQPTTDWQLHRPRPLLLLTPPEPVQVTAPIPDYPPMNFRYRGKLHTVAKADGPERIEQEWWTGEGKHRDYYCVEDEGGGRYWLFRLGHYDEAAKPQWFLHGFFA